MCVWIALCLFGGCFCSLGLFGTFWDVRIYNSLGCKSIRDTLSGTQELFKIEWAKLRPLFEGGLL